MTTTSLYHEDETEWLLRTARAVAERRWADVDRENLREYLNDMAESHRREVRSRLTQLLIHLLKWDFQPERQCKSWTLTIMEQRRELSDLLESRSLRNHAVEILPKAYRKAVKQATVETDLPEDTFPHECPYSLGAILDEA